MISEEYSTAEHKSWAVFMPFLLLQGMILSNTYLYEQTGEVVYSLFNSKKLGKFFWLVKDHLPPHCYI